MKGYIYKASWWCEDCITEIKKQLGPEPPEPFDTDRYPAGPYEMTFQEADTPQHCDKCGLFLKNNLTDYGRQYIQEHQDDEWDEYYGIERSGH